FPAVYFPQRPPPGSRPRSCLLICLCGGLFLRSAPRGRCLHRDESPRAHLHQPRATTLGDERVAEGLAHATMHAAEFRDGISPDFGAVRCLWCTRLWSVVSFLLYLDAPIALTDDTTTGRGFHGWIGRSTSRNISHVGLSRAVCPRIETHIGRS